MFLLRHAARLVIREPQRAVVSALGVAIAAGLVVSVLLFGTASGSTVTNRALSGLPIDAQVVLAPGVDSATASRIVLSDSAVRTVLPFDLVHFDAAAASKAGAATQTSGGVIVAVSPEYSSTTRLFGISSGTATTGQVAISRDLASNLGAVPGDVVGFTLPGGSKVALKVSGVVDITGADLLLGPVDAAHRAAGANPPSNVALVDPGTLQRAVISRVPPGATATDESVAAGTSPGGPVAVFAAEAAVRRELQVRFDHAQIPGDPGAAQQWLDTVRRRLDRQGAGSFTVADDASATLEPIASDLAWGQILFVFLALPGIALALALSRLAADATADATRRDLALLRARGARARELYLILLTIAGISALVGAIVGAIAAVGVSFALFGNELAATDPAGSLVRAAGIGVAAVTTLAVVAAALPLRDQLHEEVSAGRREVQRVRAPRWQRLYLDVVALLAGGLAYLVAGGSGLRPVLNAEGNPTVALTLTAFVAPLLFWSGGALLLLRLVHAVMARSRPVARLLARPLGPGGELAGQTLASRPAAASRAIAVLALALSFLTSVLIFNATYRQQQRVDAELTLGADIKATPSSPQGVAAVQDVVGSGIESATPFVDRVVYVGSEAQDLLAVDPDTLPTTAPLADGFFDGMSAGAAMNALRSQPDAILVSSETAKDYSLVNGDRVRIRVPDRTGTLRSVDFRMAGVALEFPTAPRDAFLVANLSYVASQTSNDRISWVLARANGDARAAAKGLSARLGSDWQVVDIGQTTARLANSVTSVDLGVLVLVDLGFGVLIASVGVALFLLAGVAERRREIATLEAIGAEPNQIRASLIGEALVVAVVGIAAGLATGVLLGATLDQILAGVFDPAPQAPALPLAELVAVTLAVCLGLCVGTAIADRGVARLRILSALRER